MFVTLQLIPANTPKERTMACVTCVASSEQLAGEDAFGWIFETTQVPTIRSRRIFRPSVHTKTEMERCRRQAGISQVSRGRANLLFRFKAWRKTSSRN